MFLKSIPGIILLTSTLAISAYVVQSKDANSPEQKPNETVIENKAKNNVAKIKKEVFDQPVETINDSMHEKNVTEKTVNNKTIEQKAETPLQQVLNLFDPSFMFTAVFPDIQRSLTRYKESTYHSFYKSEEQKAFDSLILKSIGFPQEDQEINRIFWNSVVCGGVQINPKINISNRARDVSDLVGKHVVILYLKNQPNSLWDKLQSHFTSLKVDEYDSLLVKENKDENHNIILKINNLIVLGKKDLVKKILHKKENRPIFKGNFKSSDLSIHANIFDFKKDIINVRMRPNSTQKKLEESLAIFDFITGGLNKVSGSFILGKTKVWEEVEFNFKNTRSGFWNLLHLKQLPKSNTFTFPKNSLEKTHINFNLPLIWKSYLNLIATMDQIQTFQRESNHLKDVKKHIDQLLKSLHTSIVDLCKNQLTGEIRGWITVDNNKATRHLWFGLKNKKSVEIITKLFNQFNLPLTISDNGILLKRSVPEKLLSNKGKSLQNFKKLNFKPTSKNAFSALTSDLTLKFGWELLPFIMKGLRTPFAFDEAYILKNKTKGLHKLFSGTSVEVESRSNYLKYKTGGYLSYTSVFLTTLIRGELRQRAKAVRPEIIQKPYHINYKNGKPMITGYLESAISTASYNYSSMIPSELKTVFHHKLIFGKTRVPFHKESFTGKWTIYHRNGVKHMEANFLQGIPQGTFLLYDDKGNKIKEANFSKKGREGMYYEWYSDGQLKTKADYKEGKKLNIFETYSKNGQILNSEILLNDGVWKRESFSKNGIRLSINYSKKHRSVREFRRWAPNGQLLEEGQYGKIGKTGKWVGYFPKGQTSYKITYNNGKGKFESWHPNRTRASIGNYKNHKQSGKWNFYWPNGNLLTTGEFKNGQKVNQWKLYHANGILMLDINHFNNKVVYPIKLFDQKGDLVWQEKGSKEIEFTMKKISFKTRMSLDKKAGYKSNQTGTPFSIFQWRLHNHNLMLNVSDRCMTSDTIKLD